MAEYFSNIIQKSPEWNEIRKGKLTCSNAQAIGNNGKWLDTLVYEAMAWLYSSWEHINYANEHIDRGNELEPVARDIYELTTGNKVEQVWFIKYNEYCGGSPDGIIWDDWLIEIKCISDVKYLKLVLNWEKEIETQYIWQCQMLLYITKRDWCDLVYFNPNFKKSMVIFRILPDINKFIDLEKWIGTGIKQIKEIQSKYIY